MHKNAALTLRGRASLVERARAGERVCEISRAMRISSHTVRKWLARFAAEGLAGLSDRSSRPRQSPRQTPAPVCEEVRRLRLERRCGRSIAAELRISPATVSRVLRRAKLSRWCELEPKPPVQRYERDQPGELLHLDIKKLGRIGDRSRFSGDQAARSRGIGFEYVHVAVDDASRFSFVTVADDEKQTSAVAFLEQVVARFAERGVRIQQVMTDNGSCYISLAFAAACRRLGIRHKRTRPYTPRTNGKAERFIQTALREWAYRCVYQSSAQRTAALGPWIEHYNWQRPHGSLGNRPPASRLPVAGTTS